VSYASFEQNLDKSDWGSISDENYCFVQLSNNASLAPFNKLLDAFVKKHITPVNPGYDLALQPLREIHFDARYGKFQWPDI
jgi:putative ABC transport system permease protein